MNSFEEKSARAAAGVYQELLLQKYAPACILVNQEEKVLMSSGAIEKYLSFPHQVPCNLLADFVDEKMYKELSKGIREVVQGEESVLIDVRTSDVTTPFYMYITPFVSKPTAESLILIEFEDVDEHNAKNTMHSHPAAALHQQFEALLRTTEHDIRNLSNNFIMLLKLEDPNYPVDNKIHDVKKMQERLLSTFKENMKQLISRISSYFS